MENVDLKQKTEELLVHSIEFIEKSGTFVAEQAPLVVQEFLMWRFVQAVVCAITLIAASIILLGVLYKCVKSVSSEWKKSPLKQNDLVITGGLIFGITSAVFTSAMLAESVSYILEAIQIKIAPRVYLLEELSKLIN